MSYQDRALDPDQRRYWMTRLKRELRNRALVPTVIVGQGTSGASHGALAAHVLRLPLILIRKDTDLDHHNKYTDDTGIMAPADFLFDQYHQALMIDDTVSSGRTMECVQLAIQDRWPWWTFLGCVATEAKYFSFSAPRLPHPSPGTVVRTKCYMGPIGWRWAHPRTDSHTS